MSIESELLHFISTEVVQDGVGVDEPLISSGKVDSMGLIQILGYVDQHYGVTLLASADPKDFESVASLAAAIRRTAGEGSGPATQPEREP
jgi:acyl carrier protein